MESEALLAPISTFSPCGDDMSFSRDFDQIAEMRREDDPTLDQGEWVTALKVADWSGVTQTCTSLLSTRTKDLRLAMWLTEAWSMTNGYTGLGQGLHLCAELCSRYWLTLHPQADGDDQEERIGNIGWVLQRVVSLASTLPVTQGREGAPFNLRDLAGARHLQTLTERSSDELARQATDKITLDQFNRALRATPADKLLATLEAARQSLQYLVTWQHIIDGHLGANGPGFVQAKEALSKAVFEIERLAREVGALHAQSKVNDAAHHSPDALSDSASTDHDTNTQATGPIRNRVQALQQLREVAGYFRRTEPHSPVAYLAEKAAKWGDMPLHEWLRKVVKDQGAMAHLQELLDMDDDNAIRTPP
ncbi:MAG: type VI secretion system protein TssA [Aquabacterium sp.]|nr:type VI secretion system protein TssA [Aquabacterium sp.]